VLILVFAVMSAAAMAQVSTPNWENTGPEVTAICKRVEHRKPPAADRPTAAQARALKGCNSEKLYYGEGVKPDYVRARQCAFVEAQGGDAPVFGGETILMQIYANGYGVHRDLDLATAYACRIDAAPMVNELQISDLQSLKAKPDHFDYCDSMTSGLAMGQCAGRDSNRAAAVRDVRIGALVAKLPPGARPLYPAMKKSFDAFVEAHGEGEVDLSGTARAAEEIGEQDSVRDQFLLDLGRLISGRWPAGTAPDARAADALLNASYRKALIGAAAKDNLTTIKSDDIRKTQRLWLSYRDAYVRFAAAAAHTTSGDAVLARLSRLRAAQLDQMLSE